MAGTIAVKLYDLLKSIGVDVSQQSGSNVKTLATKNKSTSTKPGLLASERDTGGNFATVLDIFKKDAQYINGMNDVEQMAFLNNIMDYKEFGGKSIKTSEGIKALDEAKNLTNESSDLKTSIDELLNKAKSMKADAEKGLKSAEDDLSTFFETGGNPLNKKDTKYLGGRMSEEGQIRTGIRQFLQKELKNGRINLDEIDAQRILQYSPMSEDDPILVFKKIYGDEAYNKAGSFPGAFNIGEDYNHYEKIFRENMGEDILKVKDKKYVGDGKLLLTEAEEIRTPTPDEDIPFAKGGRASFAGGKLVDEFISLIVKKEPIEAMKEVNKIIGKKGKYKNLTQKDIDRIVDQSNDHIFQRDPDNLFVGDKDIDNKKRLLTEDEIEYYEAEIGDTETWMMDGTVGEAEKALADSNEYMAAMKKEYDAASPAERAEVIGTKKVNVDDMSLEKSLTNLEGLGGTKMAERFKLKQKYPGLDDDLLTNIIDDTDSVHKASVLAKIDMAMELGKTNKSAEEIIDILKKEPETKMATGGRAGYYGGGQAMVGEDLSEIGHGSDSLMARNMQLAPNSMATTSTGLSYLLGEDNDTTRVPYNEGNMVLPKAKPAQSPLVELSRIYKTYEEAMPGVSKDTQQFLQNDFKEKLDNAKISVEEFMTYRMQNNLAEGGRIGFAGGKGVDIARRGFLKLMGATVGGVAALKLGLGKMLGKESGAVSKKAIDEVIIESGSGAPSWLQPLVNKALREGTDISKQAVKDGQVVKSLDTPTGKVDVYYDTRTGEIDIDYMGGNTALGESVNMRYVPGVADEGTKGVKPLDEFEAVETIPEGRMYSPDDYQVELGENAATDVKNLYSDTSELAELGGQKPLIKEISESIKKRQTLKKINDNPDQFASDNLPDYDY